MGNRTLVPNAVPGGMTLISTTTLSGSITTLSNIPTNYKELVIYIYGMSNATASGRFQIRTNSNTNTRWSGTDFNAVTSSAGGTLQTAANVDRTNVDNGFVLRYYNYTNNDDYTIPFTWDGYYSDGTQGRGLNISGISPGATLNTNIEFLNSGGVWSTGTIKLFGVN